MINSIGPIIALDVDGVLNSIRHAPAGDYQVEFLPRCVQAFNKIIVATDARIVLSSSWRYLIHNGHMDTCGFATMLRTHGIHGDLVGLTRRDHGEDEPRWFQIRDWLREARKGMPAGELQRFCILDDDPSAFGGTFTNGVLTDGSGLAERDADRAIEILLGK